MAKLTEKQKLYISNSSNLNMRGYAVNKLINDRVRQPYYSNKIAWMKWNIQLAIKHINIYKSKNL